MPEALAVYYDMPSTSIRRTHTLFNYYFGLYKSLLRTEKFTRLDPVLLKASRDVLLDRKITYLNCAAQEAEQTKSIFHWLYCESVCRFKIPEKTTSMKILHTVEFYSPSVGGAQEVVKQISESARRARS